MDYVVFVIGWLLLIWGFYGLPKGKFKFIIGVILIGIGAFMPHFVLPLLGLQ